MFWPEIIYHLEIEEVQCKALKQPRHMLEPRPEKAGGVHCKELEEEGGL